jgi:hypothetical protein
MDNLNDETKESPSRGEAPDEKPKPPPAASAPGVVSMPAKPSSGKAAAAPAAATTDGEAKVRARRPASGDQLNPGAVSVKNSDTPASAAAARKDYAVGASSASMSSDAFSAKLRMAHGSERESMTSSQVALAPAAAEGGSSHTGRIPRRTYATGRRSEAKGTRWNYWFQHTRRFCVYDTVKLGICV